MSEFKIDTVSSTGKKSSIEYHSDSTTATFWRSHMMKDAILELIASADLSKWDQNDAELSSDEFFKSLLTAVAERWYYEVPTSTDTSTVKEQLLHMIESLNLDTVKLSFDDDE